MHGKLLTVAGLKTCNFTEPSDKVWVKEFLQKIFLKHSRDGQKQNNETRVPEEDTAQIPILCDEQIDSNVSE